jgi:hypothetical protein
MHRVRGSARWKQEIGLVSAKIAHLLLDRKKSKNLSPASQVIRRGQESNLQSSGHEPDELTNSSTPLLKLTRFDSFFLLFFFFRSLNALLPPGKDLSEIAGGWSGKKWESLGIAWVELSKDWLPSLTPSLHTFYISVFIISCMLSALYAHRQSEILFRE